MKMGKRFLPDCSRLVSPALLVLLAPAGCIPNPDVSGLPPFDAAADDTGVISLPDGNGVDSTLPTPEAGPPEDAAPDVVVDAAVPVGTLNGVVVDYTQANGKGVLPGATVTVSLPSSSTLTAPAAVTTGADGTFTITGVPAGVNLEVSVTKPTNTTTGVAYSTGIVVTQVGANQTVSVFPVVHEGCSQTYNLNPPSGDAGPPVTLQNAQCGNPRTGAYAAMTFGSASFVNPTTSSVYAKTIRVEMIPLAYPLNGANADLSWAEGLPGQSSPPSLLGAAEYRVIAVDPGQTDDGQQLTVTSSTAAQNLVGIAIPVATTPGSSPTVYSYDPIAQAWATDTSTVQIGVQSVQPGGDAGATIQYEGVTVTHLAPKTWWALSNGAATTTCVTGTVAGANGATLVRATGSSYLGDTTATTAADGGAFCLDVNANSTIQLYAGALVSSIPSAVLQTGTAVNPGSGSCSTGTGCQAIGALTLAPILTCVSGDIAEDASAPSPLNVNESFNNLSYAASAGIQPSAYLGQVQVGTGNSFCALSVPGGSVYLSNPAGTCADDAGGIPETPPTSVPGNASVPTCGSGCIAAGGLTLTCP